MKKILIIIGALAFTAFMLAWLLQPATPTATIPLSQPITSTFIGFTNSSAPPLSGALALFRVHNHPWVPVSRNSKHLAHSQVFSIESRTEGQWKRVPTVGRVPVGFYMNTTIHPDVILMVAAPSTNQELRIVMENPRQATGLRAAINELCEKLGMRKPGSPLFRGESVFFTNEIPREAIRGT